MTYIRYNRQKPKDLVRVNGWTGFYNNEHPKSKQVVQMNLGGNFLCVWPSLSVAAFKTKVNITSISKCCHKKGRHKAGGYKWCFVEDFNQPEGNEIISLAIKNIFLQGKNNTRKEVLENIQKTKPQQ